MRGYLEANAGPVNTAHQDRHYGLNKILMFNIDASVMRFALDSARQTSCHPSLSERPCCEYLD